MRILDIYGNAASVRVQAATWVDYLHVAKSNGRWVIVNVLWELEPPPAGRIAVTPWRRVWRRD